MDRVELLSNQYAKTKEQIFSIDQEQIEGPSWKQALSTGTPAGPVIAKDESEMDKADT